MKVKIAKDFKVDKEKKLRIVTFTREKIGKEKYALLTQWHVYDFYGQITKRPMQSELEEYNVVNII